MNRIILTAIAALMFIVNAGAQSNLKKIYDEGANQIEQIDKAISKAAEDGKNVICQVGGNWCKWCLMFAEYITKDDEIRNFVDENYIYIHVNYNPRKPSDETATKMLKRLGNPGRFGYPALVVLDSEGKVIHIQDSSYLEDGNGYDKDKVVRFFKNWTPDAIR